MRVLLSPSYQLELDPKQAANREPYPPLGTLYAASRLRQDGHEVALSDSMLARGTAEFRGDLERFRPELVAIYEDDFNYLSKMCLTNMRKAAFEKARLAKEAGAFVVVHGSDATDRLEDYLRAPIDAAVVGEGEETLSELARGGCLELPRVPGLAFLDLKGGGRVVKTVPRPLLPQLDALPFPAWDLVDVDRYRNAWLERHDFFSVNMVTTRGCPYHCNWCAKPIYGQRYQSRSPASVAEELSFIRSTVRPDHVWFADDIFGLKPGWVDRFAAEVESRGLRTRFKIQARADLIDENVASALARAGCENVWMGAESGSQKVLDAMEKGIRVDQIFRATRLLRSRGIRVSFFLQFGYPGEEWSDIEKTLAMVRAARPDDIGISVSYPLPGTPFHERVQQDLRGKTNWTDSDDLDLMFRGTYPPEFYRALYRMVHSDFRLRRELARFPNPGAMARSVRHFAGLVSARVGLELKGRRRNPVFLNS
jgi:radical SAM superfamily enzyme YgiQ (UPF0313 family)